MIGVSCSTNDSGDESAIESELNEELGELEDSELFEEGEGGGLPAEDEEFFSEGGDGLAEQELQSELSQAPPVVPPPVYPEESFVPPADPPPLPDAPLTPPQGDPGAITSTETLPRNEDFELLNANESIVPNEDLGEPAPLVAEVDPPAPSLEAAKKVVPVAKVPENPFFRNERVMNTVYIARPGDDLATISKKVFDSDRTAMLLADNPHIAKGIEPGDKIYYNSPNRPDDRKQVLTYYEDNSLPVQYYTTQEGDDIQRIGKRLLGFDEAWREIYATNDSLETQALLPKGLQIRYWTGAKLVDPYAEEPPPEEEAKPVAENPNPPPMEPTDESMEEGEAATTATVEETPPVPQLEEIPPPPEDPMVAAPDFAGEALPLPPTDIEGAPPVDAAQEESSGLSIATIAGIALVGIAIIVLVAIQIKNRRKPPEEEPVPPSLEFTQV